MRARSALWVVGAAALALALPWQTGSSQARTTAQPQYYPSRDRDWERRLPEDVGMDPRLLEEAVAFARANESPESRDLEFNHHATFGREPYGQPIGPFKPRGDPTGIVLRHGYIVTEWGDPHRVDMTFSVTKNFLSTVVGLAWHRGLIRSLDDKVKDYVWTGEFDSPHNSKITWDHLLRQTSDWEGTLWGKPDWADRPPANQPLAESVRATSLEHRTRTTMFE